MRSTDDDKPNTLEVAAIDRHMSELSEGVHARQPELAATNGARMFPVSRTSCSEPRLTPLASPMRKRSRLAPWDVGLLTTQQAFIRYRETGDRNLRDRLVAEHTGVAYCVAGKFVGRGIERDDLRQVALLALLGAVERFDPARGVAFCSFAVPTILGAIKRCFRDAGWTVRPPRSIQERSLAISRAQASLTAWLGRTPTRRELATHGGWSDVDVEQALAALASRVPVSLDNDEHANADREADDALSAAEHRVDLVPMLASLEPLDRAVIRWYFGDGLTQREIGARIGVSQMQISRRMVRALDALHRAALE
jgi:RNA polymerase sigma-B factor